jgi:hypothetical protein
MHSPGSLQRQDEVRVTRIVRSCEGSRRRAQRALHPQLDGSGPRDRRHAREAPPEVGLGLRFPSKRFKRGVNAAEARAFSVTFVVAEESAAGATCGAPAPRTPSPFRHEIALRWAG